MEANALWRIPSVPGPCTTFSCVERSIPQLARPADRHRSRLLLSVALLAHSRAAHSARGIDEPLRARPRRAQGRAPAPGEPVFAGVPWAYAVEMRERGHEIVSTSESVSSCSDAFRNEKSRRRCSPDERLMSGLGQRTRQRRGASTREHRDATPRASSVVRATRRCQEVNVADRSSQFIINARMVRPCRSSCWRSASGWSHLRSR